MRTLQTLLLSALSLAASAQQWELVTPIKTRSEFTAIQMLNDDVAYAVDKPMGAILRTSDGGQNWELRARVGFDDPMTIFMWDEQHGIVAGDDGMVLLSDDGFATMSGSDAPDFDDYTCIFFINDTLGWMGSGSGKVLRSTDGGASWTVMQGGQPVADQITGIQFLDAQTGYASCFGGEMEKSTDGGLTWQSIGPFDQTTWSYDLHFLDDQLGVAVGGNGEIIRTTDGGTSWDSIPSPTTYNLNDLAAEGNVLVACGDYGRVIRSTDAGLTWTAQQWGNRDNQSIALAPGGRGLLGTDGRIQDSNDMGLTWAVACIGTWHTKLNKISFMDADTGVAIGWQTSGGFEDGLLRTTDGGRHWSKAGGGGLGVHLTSTGAGCLGGGSGSFARTTDAFLTRTPLNGPNVAIRCTWALDDNTFLVGGGAVYGGNYRTTDGGATWTHVLDVGNITISDLWFVNDLQGYAVGEYGDDYRTMDGGLTWQEMTGSNGGHTVFFLNDTLGWTGNSRTTDGGDTWTFMAGTPQYTKSIFFTDPDTGYAVGPTGQTVRSTDGGLTWANVLPEIFNAQIGDATYVDGAIIAVSRWGDIYRAQVACPSNIPAPLIAQTGNTLCASGEGSFQWYRNDELLTSDTTACIPAMEDGIYYVIVSDALGCSSSPSAPIQVLHTGIADSGEKTPFRLVPNPASGLVRVERAEGSAAVITVLDVQGRSVFEMQINGTSDAVDVSVLKSGIYLVRIASADAVEVMRLVVE